MSQLLLSLLGEPIMKHDEETLTFSTRKALALLVYLAVEGGVHERKTLSEFFWPELDAERGRAALRATLFELRKLLEGSHVPGEQAHLLAERNTLGLNRDSSLLLDLHLVDVASKRVGNRASLIGAGGDGELLAQLEQATRVIRGPFLAGFTLRDSQYFDDWTRQQREYWHLRMHHLFDALSRLYEQAGDVERAIDTMARRLILDPLHEVGYRNLMRLRFSLGDRVGALRAYKTCCQVLAQQLELEPEPETVALATWIRRTVPVRPAPLPSARSSPEQPPAKLLHSSSVGRLAEFRSLTECFQRVHAGQSHLVLLQGESGMGKTHLSTRFLGWAQAQGASVLMGKALPTNRQLPYQPLIAALHHQLEQDYATGELIGDVWLAELARLLPELRDHSPGLPVPADDGALGCSCLFEAVARLLRAWAARRPLVLLLDDMQWSDTATRDLVLYLVQSLADRPAPILLLLNARTAVESYPDPQTTWVMTLKRTGIPLTSLGLEPFTCEEMQHFVQALPWGERQPNPVYDRAAGRWLESDGATSDPEPLLSFAHWLYAQTHGQPLYLVETLKWLLEQEILVPTLHQGGNWRLVLRSELLVRTPVSALIPDSVRELLRAQLGQLTSSAQALLTSAAVMGEGLTFERLCQVSQLDEESGLQALEEVLRRGWLCEDRQSAASRVETDYIFPGELVREVVYQEAGAVRQRLIHRRVVAVLLEVASRDQDEEVFFSHPAPDDRLVSTETRERRERHHLTGAVGEETSHERAITSSYRKTPLVAGDSNAAAHAPLVFPRSPPDRAARGVLRRTEAEQFSIQALSRMMKGEKLG